QHGYPHRLFQEGDGSRWAFFPGFPLVVRSLATVTGLRLIDAALLAAFVFGLTSALAIWLAVHELFGPRLADRTVLLYVCCPTAYVLSMAYTEGLFLTAAALCLYAISRRAWVGAGLCACVAGLTRNAGIVVVLAVAVTALPAAWQGRRLRPLIGAALAPLGLVSFMAYGWSMVGTPLAFVSAERFWHGQHFVWFTTPVVALLAALGQGPFGASFVPDALAAGALVFGFLGLWWLDRMGREPGVLLDDGRSSVPAAWWVYTVGALLVAYSAYFTDSIPRYTMAAFPLFAALAWRVRDRALWVVAAGMAVVQVALLVDVLSAVHPVVDPLVP
ncbi:MAG TPA: glycosyltransferase family 39 protein, partial [Acidimicrobiales bacterium]|nr:glycosyltransferase family 39 protein [Acidimicrobiales bacterium]